MKTNKIRIIMKKFQFNDGIDSHSTALIDFEVYCHFFQSLANFILNITNNNPTDNHEG